MSTRDYKTPNEILVTVNSDKVAEFDRKQKRRGSAPPTKTPKRFLPRRKKGGRIKIYDMGRKWNGSAFVDVAYNELPTLNAVGTPVLGYVEVSNGILKGWHLWTPRTQTYDALRGAIIDYDLATIETQHPQLKTEDDAYWFNLELIDWDVLGAGPSLLAASADDLSNWSADGWAVSGDFFDIENFALTTGAYNDKLFHNLYFGFDRNKFTATYDSTAANLPDFRLKLDDKIFLMPCFDQLGARADYGTVKRDYLTSNFQVIPRTPYLDPANENYLDGINDDNPADPDAYDLKRIRFMRAYCANVLRKKSALNLDLGYWAWNDALDPAVFPTPLDWSFLTCFWAGDSHTETSAFLGGGLPHGSLIAIIKRGDDLYFAWK
jgi:hypothetical protein